jgi:predicted DNA-binding protein YlxM (UPF0122 family)
MIKEAQISGAMTIKQVAELAGVTKSSIYQAIKRSQSPLPVTYIMGKQCILTSDARKYAAECRRMKRISK